jgi:YfiH family protein
MKLGSPLLSAIPGLRHAFFTREGGVSGGIYAGLNGGIGSNDDPANVVENRRRITAADCGPILFVDPNARVIGAAHAGWKGALTGVLESTVAAMEKLGAERSGILAAIGPLIRQHSYEVGSEFVERFIAADAENALFFIPSTREGHAMFDLAGFIRMRLENAGVLMIDDLGVDTYADERFFSYRRSVHRKEPDYGRHVHAIALERE